MNNLLSYCGLVYARISAPEKKLPVLNFKIRSLTLNYKGQRQQIFSAYCTSLRTEQSVYVQIKMQLDLFQWF